MICHIGRHDSIKNGIPFHNIYPNQSQFIQFLLKASKSHRVLEIGTLAGYSTICIARSLPQSGSVTTIELDEKCAALASKNFKMAGLDDRITIRQGEALEVLSQIEKEQPEPFDFFFLDAHKPSYIAYFEWAIRHSSPGSLIIADNVIRDGDVIDLSSTDEKAIGVRHYNKMLSERSDVQTIIIPMTCVRSLNPGIINPIKMLNSSGIR